MPLTNYAIEKYLDKKLNVNLIEYSQLLDQLQDEKDYSIKQELIEKLSSLQSQINQLIEIIDDVGFKNILSKYDIIREKKENT